MSRIDPLRFIRNKFMKDAATLQVSGLLNQASQLISSSVVAFLIGSHGMGLFVTAVMLQALLYNLVNVGVVQSTVSAIAAASARELEDKVAAWLAFLVKTYFVFSAILIGAGWFVLPKLAEWWYSSESSSAQAHELGIWAWWLTFWILIDTPRAVAQVAFQGTRRMLALGQLDNGHELIRMFLVISGAAITGSPAGAVIGEVVSRVLATYMACVMYHSARSDGGPALPSMVEIFRRVPEIPLLRGLRLGLRVGLIKNTTTLVVTVLPRLLLGGTAGFAWVAYFHIAQRIMGFPLMMMQGVSRTIVPALSEKRGLHDLPGFKRLYWRTTLLAGASISACVVVGLVLVKPVVALAFPADYGWPVLKCCMILALGVIPSSFAVAQDPFYILTDRMRPNLIICFVGALVTIPANIILVRIDPQTGPVWGQTLYLAWVLVHFVYIAHYFRREAHTAQWA